MYARSGPLHPRHQKSQTNVFGDDSKNPLFHIFFRDLFLDLEPRFFRRTSSQLKADLFVPFVVQLLHLSSARRIIFDFSCRTEFNNRILFALPQESQAFSNGPFDLVQLIHLHCILDGLQPFLRLLVTILELPGVFLNDIQADPASLQSFIPLSLGPTESDPSLSALFSAHTWCEVPCHRQSSSWSFRWSLGTFRPGPLVNRRTFPLLPLRPAPRQRRTGPNRHWSLPASTSRHTSSPLPTPRSVPSFLLAFLLSARLSTANFPSLSEGLWLLPRWARCGLQGPLIHCGVFHVLDPDLFFSTFWKHPGPSLSNLPKAVLFVPVDVSYHLRDRCVRRASSHQMGVLA